MLRQGEGLYLMTVLFCFKLSCSGGGAFRGQLYHSSGATYLVLFGCLSMRVYVCACVFARAHLCKGQGRMSNALYHTTPCLFIYFGCINVLSDVHHIVTSDVRKQYQISGNWSSSWLWAILWVVGTKPLSSLRVTHILNHQTISSAPFCCFGGFLVLVLVCFWDGLAPNLTCLQFRQGLPASKFPRCTCLHPPLVTPPTSSYAWLLQYTGYQISDPRLGSGGTCL